MKDKWLKIGGTAIAIAGATSAGVLLFAGGGTAGPSLSPSPPGGVGHGVSSLETLPVVQGPLPARVQEAVRDMAARSGVEVAIVQGKLKLLRSGLGAFNSKVYAFRNVSGSICFIVTSRAASCPSSAFKGSLGFQWTIGGGYNNFPSALFGVVADDVTKIGLVVDDTAVPVSIQNNFAFAEFAREAKEADIIISRSDGTVSSDHVKLQG